MGSQATLALSRTAGGEWWFALSAGDRLLHGPLRSRWDSLPDVRELDDRTVGRRFGEVIVAVPDQIEQDDIVTILRRVRALATARVHVYPLIPRNIMMKTLGSTGTAGDQGTGLPDGGTLRTAVAAKLFGVDLASVEEGVVTAMAMVLTGVEAHRARVGKFGVTRVSGLDPAIGLVPSSGPAPDRDSREPVEFDRRSGRPPRPGRPDRFALVAAPGDTMLTVAEVVTLYGVSRSFAYGLRDKVRSYPFGGLRFRKGDIDGFLQNLRRDPPPARSRSTEQAGTRLALIPTDDDEEEVLPGITRGELKRKAGF